MAHVEVDQALVDRCRRLSSDIASEVQRFIDAHTTSGVERTVARALGVQGVDDRGTPLVNTLVERVQNRGDLGRGVSHVLGAEMLRRSCSLQEAAERLAYLGSSVEPRTSTHELAPDAASVG